MRAAGLRPFLWGAGTMLLLPLLAGAALIAAAGLLSPAGDAWRDMTEGLGLVLIASSIVTAPVAAVALPLSYIAARRGYGGWAVALLGGALLGTLAMSVVAGRLSLGTVIGGISYGPPYALLYWLGARLGAPMAFVTDVAPDHA